MQKKSEEKLRETSGDVSNENPIAEEKDYASHENRKEKKKNESETVLSSYDEVTSSGMDSKIPSNTCAKKK